MHVQMTHTDRMPTLRTVLVALLMAMMLAGTACTPEPTDTTKVAQPPTQKSDAERLEAVAAYERGDYATALQLFLPLANGGDAGGQLGLATMYDEGNGVPQNYAEAAKWYRKAADQGYPAAQVNLGLMYGMGQGVLQDYVEAHKWLNLAASRAPASEADTRNRASSGRDLIASQMTTQQMAEAQKLAREWKPK